MSKRKPEPAPDTLSPDTIDRLIGAYARGLADMAREDAEHAKKDARR